MTPHLDDYYCSAEVMGSFQETVPRKTAENTVKHCNDIVGSVVANHCGGGESFVVVTTLSLSLYFLNEYDIMSYSWHGHCRHQARL